ncbi:hypothetical protein D3C85_1680750 [compost metagenome]
MQRLAFVEECAHQPQAIAGGDGSAEAFAGFVFTGQFIQGECLEQVGLDQEYATVQLLADDVHLLEGCQGLFSFLPGKGQAGT